jgi:hypothetical protein
LYDVSLLYKCPDASRACGISLLWHHYRYLSTNTGALTSTSVQIRPHAHAASVEVCYAACACGVRHLKRTTRPHGTQFTCFTSTKVQILTPWAFGRERVGVASVFQRHDLPNHLGHLLVVPAETCARYSLYLLPGANVRILTAEARVASKSWARGSHVC